MAQQTESTQYVIAPEAPKSLAVAGTDRRFPVARIFCVGRNYADHAIEMGHDPDREEPFFFMKPTSSLVTDGRFPYPSMTADVHHEVEMVVAIGKGGRDIAVADALDHIYGYGVGLDMTRRDLQAVAKKQGRPWETAKAFDASAPCSSLVAASAIGHPDKGAVTLAVDGDIRQQGNLDQMIWKTPEIISYLSGLFELLPGDLIMTGTPAGVAAVSRGQRMEATIEGIGSLTVDVI
jgi:fumarylpyruvate hydrolase